MTRMPFVNVYASPDNHQEAYVIGNESGLRALRDAIDTALLCASGRSGADVFASDGEGYHLLVAKITDDGDGLMHAYTNGYANSGLSPYEAFGAGEYRRVVNELRKREHDDHPNEQ